MRAEDIQSQWLTDATVGTKYHVTWDDCCVAGSFEATLVTKNPADEIPGYPEWLNSATFDNGVTISGDGVEITETA